jgi:hypothetical protein
MRWKSNILLFTTAALSIGSARATDSNMAVKLISEARIAVKANLKDPSSAVFSEERVYSKTVCGQVNAKNYFGGYVGLRQYVYRIETNRADILEPQNSGSTSIVYNYCK